MNFRWDKNYINTFMKTWSTQDDDAKVIDQYLIEYCRYDTLLDVGCGLGRMARLWKGKYVGLDATDEVVEQARKAGLNVGKGNAYDLGDLKATVVLCNAVMCHVADVPRAVSNLWAATETRLIVSFYYSNGFRHKGIRPVWCEDEQNGGGWWQPSNQVPAWMIKRLFKKKLNPKPSRLRFHWLRNANPAKDKFAIVVADK